MISRHQFKRAAPRKKRGFRTILPLHFESEIPIEVIRKAVREVVAERIARENRSRKK